MKDYFRYLGSIEHPCRQVFNIDWHNIFLFETSTCICNHKSACIGLLETHRTNWQCTVSQKQLAYSKPICRISRRQAGTFYSDIFGSYSFKLYHYLYLKLDTMLCPLYPMCQLREVIMNYRLPLARITMYSVNLPCIILFSFLDR